MPGLWEIGLAVYILLTLPVLVCALEARPLPSIPSFAIAIVGLAYSTVSAGWLGALGSAISGCGCAILLAIIVTTIRRRSNHCLLNGREIRFLSASVMWLPPALALSALLGGAVFALGWVSYRSLRGLKAGRPLLPLLAAAPLLFALFGHK